MGTCVIGGLGRVEKTSRDWGGVRAIPPKLVLLFMTEDARSPDEIAAITGGDVEEIREAFESVRIIRPDDYDE